LDAPDDVGGVAVVGRERERAERGVVDVPHLEGVGVLGAEVRVALADVEGVVHARERVEEPRPRAADAAAVAGPEDVGVARLVGEEGAREEARVVVVERLAGVLEGERGLGVLGAEAELDAEVAEGAAELEVAGVDLLLEVERVAEVEVGEEDARGVGLGEERALEPLVVALVAGLDAEAEERAGVVHLERGLAAVVALLRPLPFEDRGGVAEELLRERGGVVALGGVEAGLDGEGVGAEAGAGAAPATPVAAPAPAAAPALLPGAALAPPAVAGEVVAEAEAEVGAPAVARLFADALVAEQGALGGVELEERRALGLLLAPQAEAG